MATEERMKKLYRLLKGRRLNKRTNAWKAIVDYVEEKEIDDPVAFIAGDLSVTPEKQADNIVGIFGSANLVYATAESLVNAARRMIAAREPAEEPEPEAEEEGNGNGKLFAELFGAEPATGTVTVDPDPTGFAVKKRLKLHGPLVDVIPGAEKFYTGCSICRFNLDDYAEEEGLSVAQINHCPSCKRQFEEEIRVYCYACSTPTDSAGNCLNCGATTDDPEGLKIATIAARMETSKKGKEARAKAEAAIRQAQHGGVAQQMLTRTARRARHESWIHNVEQTGRLPGGTGTGGFRSGADDYGRRRV